MSLATRKQELRAAMAARERPSPKEREVAGRAAAAVIAGSIEFAEAARIGLYAALPDELTTLPLFEAIRRAGKQSLFPRCAAAGRLEFTAVERWDRLRPGRYGVLEPPAEMAAATLCAGDLVVVPGIAFDRRGFRLGRGGGYYDRTFPSGDEALPRLMGHAFAFQVVDEVPAGPEDLRVAALVTERGLERVG